MDLLHLKFKILAQKNVLDKNMEESQRCFLYTVILIFTSNHICTLQRYLNIF